MRSVVSVRPLVSALAFLYQLRFDLDFWWGQKVKVVDRGQGLGPFSILTPNCKANAAGSLTTVSWASVTPHAVGKETHGSAHV